MGGGIEEADYDAYRGDLLRLCDLLEQRMSQVILLTIFDSITRNDITSGDGVIRRLKEELGAVLHSKKKEIFDIEACVVTRKRSEIIMDVAKERGYACCDIRTWLNESPYKHIDHIHYEHRSKVPIVKEYMKCLSMDRDDCR